MKTGRKVRGVFWRDGQWWIRWACTLGHDHRKPSGDLKTAASEEHKAKRAEVREARKAGRECCPRLVRRARPLLVGDLLSDYMVYSRQNKRSHEADRARAARLSERFGNRLAADVTGKDVEEFKAALSEEENLSVASVNHHLKLFKAVYNRATRLGNFTGHNPVAAVRLSRENNARNRCLTAEEEARLLEALPTSLRPFVLMALHTGMRRGELRALRWEDVDLANGALRVRRDKAGDGRWVALNRVALEALRTVKREQRVSGAYVFCSPEGRFLHNFERYWRPALRAAVIPDFRFHDCRHTFASRLAMAGTDLYTVQRAGGWKSQAMVQRYAHLSPDHIRAAVERLAQPGTGVGGTKTGTGQ
jgi:integrase